MGLAGKRVLVVEDEPMIAMLVEDILTDLGCVIVGPAGRLADALLLAERETLDLAILDLNLGADDSLPVAALLKSKDVPFAFATGYGTADEAFADVPVLTKPYRAHEMSSVLGSLLAA